jgi:uncharacterized protein (DUF2236 family)
VYDSGILRVDDSARRIADLFRDPPKEAEWRPVLKGVSRLAFGTLPPTLREAYGFPLDYMRRAAMHATFSATRLLRPVLPSRYRYIAPYQDWRLSRRGKDRPSQVERARRAAGIRLTDEEPGRAVGDSAYLRSTGAKSVRD